MGARSRTAGKQAAGAKGGGGESIGDDDQSRLRKSPIQESNLSLRGRSPIL